MSKKSLSSILGRLDEKIYEQKSIKSKTKKLKNGGIRTQSPDNCVRLFNGKICLVVDFQQSITVDTFVCQLFLVSSPFFLYPCNSSDLGIVVVSNLSREVTRIKKSEICQKMVLLPKCDLPKCDSSSLVAIPLCHSE